MTGACLFVCVAGPGFDSTSPALVRSRPAMRHGATAGLQKNRNRVPISGGRAALTQFVQMSVVLQPSADCVCLEHLFLLLCTCYALKSKIKLISLCFSLLLTLKKIRISIFGLDSKSLPNFDTLIECHQGRI